MTGNIHFILTGGTIEKSYDPLTEKPEFRCHSILPDYLNDIIKVHPDLTFNALTQIDSLDMTEDIREDILVAVNQCDSKHMVITHGTSTMEDTAQYLAENLVDTDKTIILTGAMIPLKEFAMSDGGFNIGYAIAKVQNVESGIYIAMNARLFAANDVTKNTNVGQFEGIKTCV